MGYKVHYGNATGDYAVSVDVGNKTTHTLSDLAAGKGYYIAVTAYDSYGNESDFSNEVFFDNMGEEPDAGLQATVVAAINTGGPQYTSADGIVYQADAFYSGGSLAKTPSAISGTNDDVLYQSERYGNFSYNIPLVNGQYTVVFKFAEIYWSLSNKRVFDVTMESQEVITDLDLFAKVGKYNAHDVELSVTVADGVLNIVFERDIDNAKVGAILVKSMN